MRLLFEKDKQKELIKKFRKEKDITQKELAKFLNLKEGRLKSYFDESSLIPEEVYKKLDKKKEFSEFIIEKKEEGWGRKLGGKNSMGKTKEINFPEESANLAEFYGIMLGDGNSTRLKGYKIGTYMIRIVGDLNKDREYLMNYVKPLIERLFKIKVRIGKFKSNAMFVEAHSKKLIDFLESKGFKPGDKIRNNLGIPKWIKSTPRFLRSCLRGLYDTDGSVYKITNQNSHQINFCNYNQRLLSEAREAIKSLGITPSKITKGQEFNITKKSELTKFLKTIGFSNSKHLNKVKMWKIAP